MQSAREGNIMDQPRDNATLRDETRDLELRRAVGEECGGPRPDGRTKETFMDHLYRFSISLYLSLLLALYVTLLS